MKSFSVTAFFPDVKPAHSAFQSCVSKGSDVSVAAGRGLALLRTRPNVKGKRIREVRLTIREVSDSQVQHLEQ